MFSLKPIFSFNNGSFRFRLNELKYQWGTLPKAAWQRATKGWAEWDIIGPGFDETYCVYIGHALITLSNNAYGAPCGYGIDNTDKSDYNEYVTDFDAWVSDLVKYGNILINNTNGNNYNETKEALHWVADHYYSLWS